jgi:hypothetical protein
MGVVERVKAPHARDFVHDVMRRLECRTVRDLAKKLGWTGDEERKLYKWEAGEQAPNMRSTIALLSAAGLLLEEPLATSLPGAAAPADFQGGLEEAGAAIVKELRSGFRKIDRRLQALEQQRNDEAPRSQPRAAGAGSR